MDSRTSSHACWSSNSTPAPAATAGCYFPSVNSLPMQIELDRARLRDQGLAVASQRENYFVPLQRQPMRSQMKKLVLSAPSVVRRRDLDAYDRSVAADTRARLEGLGVKKTSKSGRQEEGSGEVYEGADDGRGQVCENCAILMGVKRLLEISNVQLPVAHGCCRLGPEEDRESAVKALSEHQAALTQEGVGSLDVDTMLQQLSGRITSLDTEKKDLLARISQLEAENRQYCAMNNELTKCCEELRNGQQKLWKVKSDLERGNEELLETNRLLVERVKRKWWRWTFGGQGAMVLLAFLLMGCV